MSEDNEHQLVERARAGDRAAFQELVERYQRRVFNVCYGMVRNRDDAMDLTQETFVRVHRNLSGFQGNASFYTWIYRIAKNVTIDWIRKAQRRRAVDYDDTIRRDPDAATDDVFMASPLGISPARVLGRKELLERIEEAMSTLSDAHREVIVLREIEGMSYQDIADAAGISIGTVMSRLHHARKYMQRSLQDYVGDELRVDGDRS